MSETQPSLPDTRKSQSEQILSHLKSGGRISQLSGLNLFKCMATSQRISELRRAGWAILDERVKRNGKSFKEYFLKSGAERTPTESEG